MSEAAEIPYAQLQKQTLELAGARVVWLLERQGVSPDLDAELPALGAIAPNGLGELLMRFGLDELQRDLLLLAAAPELSLKAAAAVSAHPLSVEGRATPLLAEDVLGPDAPTALGSTSHLRSAGLVTLDPGPVFAYRPMAVDPAVVMAMRGVPQPSEAVLPGLRMLEVTDDDYHDGLAEALRMARDANALIAVDGDGAAEVAAAAFAALGLRGYLLDPEAMAGTTSEIAQAINRDMALLSGGVILPSDHTEFAEQITAPMILTGPPPRGLSRAVASLRLTGEPPVDGLRVRRSDRRDDAVGVALGLSAPGTVSRTRAAEGLDGLAQAIEPQATWQDLVLPEAQMAQLKLLARYQAHERTVFDDWGFRAKSARGLGMAALFSGPSGTGKTTAAEIVAREMGAGLYRVDLSAVVSKYIGETEKNIGQIFDAAEGSGAVLIFDEGEALFAKRTSEVKDSNDRHANVETAFLLQRLEAFSGCAIVTTNLKSNVDEAFLRRFRVAVEFPFPSADLRRQIWQRVFPDAVPLADLNLDALARLAIAGGTIRSVALTTAFLAAAEESPVTMALIAQAVRQEYGKIGKPLSEPELRGLL